MSIIYRKKTQLLADYAQQVLSNFNSDVIATLNRRQVPTSKIVSLESVYQIEINLEDQVNLILIQAILKKQIEAVAEFLRDFHIAINGQRTSIFQIYEVEIKVKNYFQCNLSFLAGKLS
ncbi:MAG: hypothetical protein SAK42_22480, partial [Oscillatoria sp. PMC 1076.18]|nr:hypothetical protein [Oscillatoria sp. PMC 1076.18]